MVLKRQNSVSLLSTKELILNSSCLWGMNHFQVIWKVMGTSAAVSQFEEAHEQITVICTKVSNPLRQMLDTCSWKWCTHYYLCTNATFYDTQVEVDFFSREQTKRIHEAPPSLGQWFILKCKKWDFSMFKRSVEMGHLLLIKQIMIGALFSEWLRSMKVLCHEKKIDSKYCILKGYSWRDLVSYQHVWESSHCYSTGSTHGLWNILRCYM